MILQHKLSALGGQTGGGQEEGRQESLWQNEAWEKFSLRSVLDEGAGQWVGVKWRGCESWESWGQGFKT